MRTLRFCPSWNIGIMEYWNNGLRAMRTRVLFFPIIPSFHHSLTLLQIRLRYNGAARKAESLRKIGS
jgi:hypothetical protein